MIKDSFVVKGMTCSHCLGFVTRTLENIDGVKAVLVDLESGKTTVDFDESKTSTAKLMESINKTGIYSAAQ